MDVALVEHAENDVHRHDRRQDEEQRAAERVAEGGGRALELALDRRRHAELALERADGVDRVAERGAARQVERDGRRRELADVVDRERRRAGADARERIERHLLPAGGSDADLLQRLRRQPEFGLYFQHHAVLRCLREDGRDQALAEGVIERRVDGGRRDAEASSGIAVDIDVGLQSLVLEIGCDVGQLAQAR